eukprot:Awhi_evm1s4738
MDIDINTYPSEYKKKRWGQFCASCKKIQTSTAERKSPDGSTSDPREVMKIDAQHFELLTKELKAEAESDDQ